MPDEALDASLAIDWDALVALEHAVSPTPRRALKCASEAPSKARVRTRSQVEKTRPKAATQAESTSPSVTSSDNEQANNAVVTKPTRKKRFRRSDEIARLRAEAETLDAQLLKVREDWKQQSFSAIFAASYAKSRHGQQRWRSVAAYEKETVQQAMEANDELRAECQWQKRLARDLRKILMRRVNIAAKFDCVFYNMQAPSATDQVLANGALNRLLHDLAPMAPESERLQRLLQDRERRRGTHTFREWNVRHEAQRGLFLELVNSYALPFDFALVNNAVRRQFGEDTTYRAATSFCEYFNHAGDDATVHQSIVRMDNTKGIYNVRFREAVQCIRIGATHVLFLSTKLIEPVTFSGEPIRSTILRERKWTVVRGGDLDGDHMTSVQSFHVITPEVIHEGFEGEWTRRKLEGEMIPAWDVTLDTSHRRLESDILEHRMRRSLPSLLPPFPGSV